MRKSLTSRSRRRQSLRQFKYLKLEDRIVLTAGGGLLGQYYANPDLTDLALVRVDPNVDYDWGTGSYDANGSADSFSVRWSGQVESQFTETYTLFVNANDGARLWVNGQSLVDQFESALVNEASATIELVAGRKYDIQLEYRENTGDASVKLEWSSDQLSREVIPSARLFQSDRGSIRSEMWNGIAGSDVADLTIDSSYPNGPDVVGARNSFSTISNTGDNFGTRLSGFVHAPKTGPYTFYVAANESAELWLSNSADANQKQMIASVDSATQPEDWHANATQKSGAVYLVAGQKYYIESLHKEAVGDDHLAVGWVQPGSLDIEVIDGEHLSADAPEVRIYSNRPNAAEGSTPSSFTVVRTGGPTNNPLPVSYQLAGDATNGVDYQTLSGTITIPAGSESIELTISALADSDLEGAESVIIELQDGTGYTVGLQSERTSYGKIQDDAPAPTGGVALFNGNALSDFSQIGNTATFSTVNDPIEGSVIQVEVPAQTNNPWNIQLKQGIDAPVNEGDLLLAQFRVRSVGGDGELSAVFEKSSTPFTKSINQGLPATDGWVKVQIPFVALEDYAINGAGFGYFLGHHAQTLRLTDIEIINYGPPKTLSPETAFFLNNLNGGTYGVGQIVNVANQDFSIAYEVQATSVPTLTWHLQAVDRNEGAVGNGDTMRFEFSVRATAGTTPRTQFTIQRTDTFATLHSQLINLTPDWQPFSIDVAATDDFDADGLQAVFNLGYEVQTVEIGGFHWINQGNLFDLDDLPKQFPAASYEGRSGTDAWRNDADDRIENDRKRDVTINVTDANGLALSGAVVSLRQTVHAFLFGSAINAYGGKLDPNGNETAAKYQSEIDRLFNTVVFENSLKWPGYLNDSQRAIDGVNWAVAADKYIRGHNIIWPSRKSMPASIWSEYDTRVANDGQASADSWLNSTLNARFDEVLTQFDGLIPEWDVVNEPWTNNDVMTILGDSIVVDWFQRVRDHDSSIELVLNDYGIFASNGSNANHRSNFDYWLGLLRDANLLDVIGEQSHYNDSNLTDISVFGQLVSTYQTQFNAPVAITEFDVDTGDEQLQADYLRDYMTMAFSQTAVTEFLHWGFWESSHWLPDASLYRYDFSIKPNGQAYEDLVFGSWWTDLQATTRNGAISANAFFGDYDVLVEYDGQTYSSTMTIDATGNSTFTINVPADPINYDPLLAVNNANVTGNVASLLQNSGVWLEPEHETATLAASLGDVTKDADGSWSWSFTPEQRYQTQLVTITATDIRGGVATATFTVDAETVVASRSVSYGGSTFGADIATNKSPLLPGETATFENYTNHSRGLNRVMVDVAGLASTTLSVDDFEFRVGNSDDPSGWLLLDATSSIPLPTVSVVDQGAGVSQIMLAWPDNAIENMWLQVVVLSNLATGLNTNDVFYFGNAIADTGNHTDNTIVNLEDVGLTRINQSGFSTVGIENDYDFNRDGRVDLVDVGTARSNQSGFSPSLNLITVPGGGSGSGFSSNRGASNDGGNGADFANDSANDQAAHSQDEPAKFELHFGTSNETVADPFVSVVEDSVARSSNDVEMDLRSFDLVFTNIKLLNEPSETIQRAQPSIAAIPHLRSAPIRFESPLDSEKLLAKNIQNPPHSLTALTEFLPGDAREGFVNMSENNFADRRLVKRHVVFDLANFNFDEFFSEKLESEIDSERVEA